MSESVAVTASTESPVRISRSRRNTVFITVALGMLLAALDQTIVATALPTIVGDLGGWRRRSAPRSPASSVTCSAAGWSFS